MTIQGLDLRLLRMCAGRTSGDDESFDRTANVLSKFSFHGYWSVGLEKWMWARYAFVTCAAGSMLLHSSCIPTVPTSVRDVGLFFMLATFVFPFLVILAVDRLVVISINRSRRGRCSVCDYPFVLSNQPIGCSRTCTECGSFVLSPDHR